MARGRSTKSSLDSDQQVVNKELSLSVPGDVGAMRGKGGVVGIVAGVPTVVPCLGTYGDPRGVGVSNEPGTPGCDQG